MPETTVLRIGVAAVACSGFQYSLGFDEQTDTAKDHVSNQHGIPVAVDKKRAVSRRDDGRLLRRARRTRLHLRESERREDLRLRPQLFGLRRALGLIASPH